MKTRNPCCIALLISALLFCGVSVAAAPAPQLIAGQYIVTLDRAKTNSPLAVVVVVQNLLSLVGGGDVLNYYTNALPGATLHLNPLQAALLRSMSGVVAVEQDQKVFASATQNSAQYNLDRIDQRSAFLDQVFNYPDNPGQGTHLYIIDTGLNANHVEFTGRVGNGRNFAPRGRFGGINAADTSDCAGHGTHVAGIAAGSTYGVAKRATLHPVRVLDCGGAGSISAVIAGIDWVIANHVSPAVANLSLGASTSATMDQAIRNLVNAGVTTAVAAGNDNENACNTSPAREPLAITVGSTTSTDARSSFSNFGSCVDIFAPGSNIVSASNTSNTGTRTLSGTSMASPLVAGVASVFLGQNPSAPPSVVAAALVDVATQNAISSSGSGSPNRLLYLTDQGGAASSNQAPTASFSFQCSGTSCDFDAGDSTDDVLVTAYAWDFGDGSQSTGETTSHTYSQGGAYTVVLTVTDAGALADDETQTVNVTSGTGNPPPVAAFSVVCNGAQCSFDASTSSSDVVSYAWIFGDGQTGSGVAPVHAYAVSGSYPVQLTVTDDVAQSDSESRSVSVSVPGTAPCTNCTQYTGRIRSGSSSVFPVGINGIKYSGGTISGYLTGPAGADFDLYLERPAPRNTWAVVASAVGAGSTHQLSVNVAAGTYRWRIFSKSGSGDYVFYGAPK